MRYMIVEHAGYEGELDVRDFPTAREARAHRQSYYDADELDPVSPNCLHVYIRADWTDDQGAEQSEYID
jgi:hypothetical protein